MRSSSSRFLTITGKEKLAQVQSEHEAILKAIKASDPKAAEKAMNDHIGKLMEIPVFKVLAAFIHHLVHLSNLLGRRIFRGHSNSRRFENYARLHHSF